jgi:hypothetical protein
MSQCNPLPASVPAYAGSTQNSEVAAGAAGSFDLLWLSDLIISVLENESIATSTGAGQSATFFYAEESPRLAELENLSVKTADSSAIMAGAKASLHAH